MLSPWEIGSLSSVCFLLRETLTPLVFRKFTLPQIYGSLASMRKANAIASSPAWLQSTIELELRNKVGHHTIRGIGVNSSVSRTLKAVPQMACLQTVKLTNIRLSSNQLVIVLRAPKLRKITLIGVALPGLALAKLPPTSVRHLSLQITGELGNSILLWTHLSASLEVLELQPFEHFDNLPPLPPCPRLHTFLYVRAPLLPDRRFHEFINSCPNLTRVTASVMFYHPFQIVMPPSTLRYLCLHHNLLYFNLSNVQLPGLVTFRITGLEDHYTVEEVLGLAEDINSHFPNLLHLELEVSWPEKNYALALARFVLSVRTLHLVITTTLGLKEDEDRSRVRTEYTDILWGHIGRQKQSAKLQRLSLEVTQHTRPLDDTTSAFLSWWMTVITTYRGGLGGPDLSETDITYFCPGASPPESDIRRWCSSKRAEDDSWGFTLGDWYELEG